MIAGFAQRWHEIEPLIDQLFDVPVGDRDEWLRRHCRDAALRALVTTALDNTRGIEILEHGVLQCLPDAIDGPVDVLPVISGYRVHRFIGAGGMASVFEAERELPGGPQRVALKLLRIDVHDPGERQRFMREQRILARLQHPHIAQLLDAGFSQSGTPFLALEFVAGGDLVQNCRRRNLSVRERLALFVDVCSAVEHAHRSLIVHRDLKPSNVLVDVDGCIKLVDFGIAKLLDGESGQTQAVARRLTRSYAAPEQFSGDEATTAIDVYALGVLLIELLCGLKSGRDSEAADTYVPAFDDYAVRRSLGVDLHAIVHWATQADPQHRYPSVAMLRADIENHLQGKPLRARADTFAYRVFTLAKRNIWAVAAGTAIAAILAGATVVGLYESHLARHAAMEARAQALAAEGEAQRADALKSFLEGLFDNAPHGTGASATAEVLLAHGRAQADRDFAKQPSLRIEILALIGNLERRSGHPDHAQQPLDEAAALAKRQFGATDRRTLHIEYLLAEESDALGHVRSGRLRLQNAIAAFQAGPNRDSPEEVQALAWLAGLDERMGESTKAISTGKRALALARRVLPDESPALTDAITNLGWILMDAGHPDSAVPLLHEAMERKRRRLGSRHPDVADAMTLLTSALIRLGRYAESERLMRKALDIDASAYSIANAHVAWHLNDFANVLALEGKFEEAKRFYDKSLAVDKAIGTGTALGEAMTTANLARLDFREGAYAEAEVGLRDAINRKQHLLGADYDDNGRSYDQACLAEILAARGQLDEAGKLADSSLAEARQRHREAHPDVAFALMVKAQVLAAIGAHVQAAKVAGQSVAMYAALSDLRSAKATRAHLVYAGILQNLGRDREARTQLASAFAAASAAKPNTFPLVASIEAALAHVDALLGDSVAARQYRAKAEASLEKVRAGPNTDRGKAMELLVEDSVQKKL